MSLKFKDSLYTKEDCIPGSERMDYEGRVLVVDPKVFDNNYRKPEYQLVKAIGGFGCKPYLTGTAVAAEFLCDGETARWERYDFLGILKDELIPIECEGEQE